MQTLAAPRRHSLFPLAALLLLALLGTLPFWLTDLDLRAAALFYRPNAEDPWFASRQAFWLLLYQLAPLLIGLTMIGSLAAALAGTLWPRYRRLRIPALLLLLAALLGPGLTINVLLKDHWGRPRPHQTVAFGGVRQYLPPLAMGTAGTGKSFPCGHSSVGFLFGAWFLIWRRQRPRLAALALLGSLVLGGLFGIGRMTAGDHFLSDVIWSGVIVYGLIWILYCLIHSGVSSQFFGALRARSFWASRHRTERDPLPASVARRAPAYPIRYPLAVGLGYGLLTLALLFGVLLGTPVDQNRSRSIVAAHEGAPRRTLRLLADTAQVTLTWHDWPDRAALILVKGRGFGLPGTRVRDTLEARDGVLTLRVAHSGWFVEKDTSLVVGIVPDAWERIEVALGVGDIRVHPLPPAAPALDLKTGQGQVRRDLPAPIADR